MKYLYIMCINVKPLKLQKIEIALHCANKLGHFFLKNRENRTFSKFFLEIGQNYQVRKYVHVFPWGRKHTVKVIL